MKPLEFRVWDKLHECFSSDEFFIDKNGTLLEKYWPYNEGYYTLSEDYENRYKISYSTGLFDKNGKEIFTGDIVDSFTPSLNLYVVIYDDLSCSFRLKNIEAGYHCGIDDYISNLEVVGNKFENPELLSGLK